MQQTEENPPQLMRLTDNLPNLIVKEMHFLITKSQTGSSKQLYGFLLLFYFLNLFSAALERCVSVFSLSVWGMLLWLKYQNPKPEVHNRNPDRSLAAWVGAALATRL